LPLFAMNGSMTRNTETLNGGTLPVDGRESFEAAIKECNAFRHVTRGMVVRRDELPNCRRATPRDGRRGVGAANVRES